MLRTLHVITDRDRRGAQVHALDLAGGLLAADVGAVVVALAPGEQDDSLDVEVLGPRRLAPTTIRHLSRRAREFDVVVAHGSTTLAACALAVPPSVPFIYRQISDPLFWAASLPRRLRTGALLRRARAIVALAPGVAETFARYYGLPSRRVTVISNAVPADAWAPASRHAPSAVRSRLELPEGCFVGIALGALVPEKGVDLAVRAIAAQPGAHLLIAGKGPTRAALGELADLHAPGRIHFLGAVEDPRSLLQAADSILFPSRGGDSMPAVLIEAGLSGVPAVATPVGAIEEIVIDGKTGLVAPVGDQAAFSSAVERLAQDDALRRSMAAAAREHCLARFTIRAVVPRWIQLFRSVVT